MVLKLTRFLWSIWYLAQKRSSISFWSTRSFGSVQSAKQNTEKLVCGNWLGFCHLDQPVRCLWSRSIARLLTATVHLPAYPQRRWRERFRIKIICFPSASAKPRLACLSMKYLSTKETDAHASQYCIFLRTFERPYRGTIPHLPYFHRAE